MPPFVVAGTVLGVGLGGFIDGIVLHQILQWHHMLTSGPYPPTTLENLQVNTLWDGLFHAFTWVVTAIGLSLLWRASRNPIGPWSTRVLVGCLAIGWGLFNVVEGIVNHYLLGFHHVREDVPNVALWDLAFLAFGVVLIAIGAAVVRAGQKEYAKSDTRTRGKGARVACKAN